MRILIILLFATFLLPACDDSSYLIKPANVVVTPPADVPEEIPEVIPAPIEVGDEYEGGIYAGELNSQALVTTPGNCDGVTCDGADDTYTYDFWSAYYFCYDLDYGGKTDWFLPYPDEAQLLYTNHGDIGGFYISSSQGYWTYWQYYYSEWYSQLFDGGSTAVFYDYDSQYVRCVRHAPSIPI